jgi:hypothetical protein
MTDPTKTLVVDVKWYTSFRANIGIVLIKTFSGHKAYIDTVDGDHELMDVHRICEHGGIFPDGHLLWPHIKDWAG